jgi:hypothetical protein
MSFAISCNARGMKGMKDEIDMRSNELLVLVSVMRDVTLL